MIFTLLIIAITFVFSTFLGYWAHLAFHQSWSGIFYRAHTNHHTIQYPPNDFISEKYRSAGKYNSAYYFTFIFLPIIGLLVSSVFFLGISTFTCLIILATMLSVGLLHDNIHDSFHLQNSIWHHLPFHKKWQQLHLVHHIDQSKNFGVYNFLFDKLFKTFQNNE